MPRYFYKAKSLRGEQTSGVIEAESETELANVLRKKGYFLLGFDKDKNKSSKSLLRKIRLTVFSFGVPLKEKLFFTRNLEVMIRTGVPLPKAFNILARQSKSKKFQKALEQIADSIVKGKSLSGALMLFPKIFPPLYYETLKVGEETGKLEDALKILSSQMEREHNLKSKIKAAMMYPAVVMCMAVLIGVVMMIFAVPQLKEAFEDLGVELPLSTRIILGVGDFLSGHWLLSLIFAAIFAFILVLVLRSGKGGKAKSYLALKIPVISRLTKKVNSALALRILSSLLKAGVPIVHAMEVTAGALNNFYFKQSLAQSAKIVQKGRKISQTLKPYEHLYSSMVLQMMEVGEETGETSAVLEKLASFYEEEVATSTEKLSSVIEPVLILFVGGAVGLFAVSMMQPMFSVMGGIQ